MNGRWVLVGGGSGGIGRAVCRALARDGWDVALTYRSNEAAAKEAEADVIEIGRQARTIQLDLTDGAARYFPGGRVKFDDKGRRVGAQLLIVQWQNGQPVTVFPADLAVATPIWPKR